jgi:hypothetical protein
METLVFIALLYLIQQLVFILYYSQYLHKSNLCRGLMELFRDKCLKPLENLLCAK